VSLVNLENRRVKSSGDCSSATYTLLSSKLCMELLTSDVGQLDGSCDNHGGPFHHRVYDDR
jgi:hypothetical protein